MHGRPNHRNYANASVGTTAEVPYIYFCYALSCNFQTSLKLLINLYVHGLFIWLAFFGSKFPMVLFSDQLHVYAISYYILNTSSDLIYVAPSFFVILL